MKIRAMLQGHIAKNQRAQLEVASLSAKDLHNALQVVETDLVQSLRQRDKGVFIITKIGDVYASPELIFECDKYVGEHFIAFSKNSKDIKKGEPFKFVKENGNDVQTPPVKKYLIQNDLIQIDTMHGLYSTDKEAVQKDFWQQMQAQSHEILHSIDFYSSYRDGIVKAIEEKFNIQSQDFFRQSDTPTNNIKKSNRPEHKDIFEFNGH